MTLRRMAGATALLVCLLIGGCEYDYGINRIAELKTMPDVDCVRRALADLREITSVDESHSEQPTFHRYRYAGDGFWAYASFRRDADGTVVFLNSRISVNRRPSPEEVSTTRRIMRAVEGRLARECSLPDLVSKVSEECVRVACRDS